MRIRSDDQLVSLFRAGSEEAFRAIHDRYRQRMFAYTRQMLAGSSVDAEDAVQEIFVRAYSGLRASDRHLALRAWLYRIAHNRCIDELRRPQAVPSDELPAAIPTTSSDPVVRLEQRDALRRLIADVQRLPDQQRSALLMRELAGMTYADVSGALGVSVPAVKSLLVRARVGLAQANDARDTSCNHIREDLIVAHDRGVRASGLTRRHLRDCPSCRQFRSEVRGVSRQLAGFVPALGPIGVIAKLLGLGGGGGAAASTAVAGGGTTAATGATGAIASVSAVAGAGHIVTILAAAVVTAGGAIELQHIAPPVAQHAHHQRVAAHAAPGSVASPRPAFDADAPAVAAAGSGAPSTPTGPAIATSTSTPGAATGALQTAISSHEHGKSPAIRAGVPLSEMADPDNMMYLGTPVGGATTPTGSTSANGAPSTTAAGTAATGSTSAGGTTVGTAGSPTSATSTGTNGSTVPTGTGTGGTSGSSGTTGANGTSGTSSPTSGTSSPSSTTSPSTVSTASTTPTTTVIPASSIGSSGGATPIRLSRHIKHAGAVAVLTITSN